MSEDELKKMSEELTDLLPKLEEALKNIEIANIKTGADKKAKKIRDEIKTKGWNTILKLYLPENNTQDPAAIPLFEMYKYIYEDMKIKGEI